MTDKGDESERFVYVQRIDPAKKSEYVDAHEDVPDGVTEAMERGGATTFELFVRDDVAVCVLEVEDIDDYLDAVTGDPAVEDWERHVAQFKRDGVDVDAPEDEQIPFMDRIWTLDADA